jgi:N-formylglutamate amidohydrolase
MKAFFISIPHSGEKVPAEATWLNELPEPILMCDVDRYVDRLYIEAIKQISCPSVIADWHRYVVDLNRLPTDIDIDSVVGASAASGKFSQGLHWLKTTKGQPLLTKPMSMAQHLKLVQNYFEPFHEQVRAKYSEFRRIGATKIYHLDAHSMPSLGTKAHRDPGQLRAEIVVSDQVGKSCDPFFKDLVIKAYSDVGFKVAYNWPYIGGRVTETYGKPANGQHTIQVELNRALYMDEETKQYRTKEASEIAKRITTAVVAIEKGLPQIHAT